MKRIRVWMMMIGLLTMAATVNAQSLPPASVQSVIEVGLQSADPSCQNACNPCWFSQAAHHAGVALQRLRLLCAGSNSACCEAAQVTGVAKECCAAGAAKGFQVQVQTTGTGGLMLGQRINSNNGVIGHIVLTGQPAPAAPCCGVKDMLQLNCPLGFIVGKSTTPCCCAKACACCETCKAKPVTTVQIPAMGPLPMAFPSQVYWPAPAQPVVQGSMLPPPGARVVVGLPTSTPQANRPAHLVTPDLEAHCERMTHRGDTIVLEGNVLLLSKKHAQPVRIEGQRVLVNMKDGSFTVESTARAVTPVSFGVLRMSGVEEIIPGTTTHRIIQVLPVPAR